MRCGEADIYYKGRKWVRNWGELGGFSGAGLGRKMRVVEGVILGYILG